MDSNSSSENVKPHSLSSAEINKILSMTLIANLATLGEGNTIHIVPMWFIRLGNDICIPTSRHTHKYRNLKARPYASGDDRYFARGIRLKRDID
jgi:nitroimidazol reductase NimA-like FMN-containing flavoprotein (pyridoxamine 5'-phosphate oxidase superfamily)